MILLNNAYVSIPDFSEEIFSSGLNIYEVVRIFEKHPIFLSDNLIRLDNSIKKSRLCVDIRNLHIEKKIDEYIRLEKMDEGNLKFVLHFTDAGMDEYLYRIPHHYPTEEDYRNGVVTVSCKAIRRNPEVKYVNTPLRTMADELLGKSGAYEAVLIDNEGCVTEGSRSNLFFVKNDVFYTAPTEYVLPGTARKRVLDICKREGFAVCEKRVSYSDLGSYDAACITGTSPLVLPISRIDHYAFSVQNPWLRKLMERYFNLIRTC